MAGKIKASASKSGGGQSLLCPGDQRWEWWALPLMGAPDLKESWSEMPSPLPFKNKVTVALPIAQVFAVPLWLATTDKALMPDLIQLQLERRGLLPRYREDAVFDFRVVRQEPTESLVLVTVLPSQIPDHLLLPSGERFDVSANFFPLEADCLTLWREGDRLVAAVTNGTDLVYFQGLTEGEVSPALSQEILCLYWELNAQRIAPVLKGIQLWGQFTANDAKVIEPLLGVPVRIGPKPTPRPPHHPFQLTPRQVQRARVQQRQSDQKKQILALFVSAYLLLMAGWAGHALWLRYQVWKLENQISQNAGLVKTLKTTAQRWDALELCINPNIFPLENLLRCSQAVPGDGLRLTLFEQQDTKILITGEAKNAPTAFKFADDLKHKKDLAEYRWQMPQPRLLPNDTAQFQLEGVRSNASADE